MGNLPVLGDKRKKYFSKQTGGSEKALSDSV
jgi:hypothetical protein